MAGQPRGTAESRSFTPDRLTIDNAGSWNTLPDGKRVWRLQVQAKDAIALMLSFRDFYNSGKWETLYLQLR